MRPSGEHMRYIFGVSGVLEKQVIGPIKAYKALGVFGSSVNMTRIINAHHPVLREWKIIRARSKSAISLAMS